MNISNNRVLKIVCIWTSIFVIVAHGFCYFNIFYSHDSLYSFDISWDRVQLMISTGRYIQPLIYWINRCIPAPTLIGTVAVIFFSISSYLIIKMLDIKGELYIISIVAILVVNSTITLLNASYMDYSICYHIALFLAVLGTYVIRDNRYHDYLGVLLWIISLGLYQCYSSVAIVILMILIIKDIINGVDLIKCIKTGIKYFVLFICSLALYYLIWKILLLTLGIPVSNHNNYSTAGQFTGILNIIECFVKASGKSVIAFFVFDTQHPLLIGVVNGLFAIILIGFFTYIIVVKELSKDKIVSIGIIVLLIPFAVNYTSFLGRGVYHRLMIYAVNLVYIFGIYLISEVDKIKNTKLIRFFKYTMMGCVIVVVIDGCVYSNNTYLYKNLVYQNTNLVMNRIVDRIEQVDEYIPGETPVCFVGKISGSMVSPNYDEFNTMGVGLESVTSVSYYGTYQQYFDHVMRYPIVIYKDSESTISSSEEVINMPSFPKKDCCKMINDVLVVKLAN